MVSKLNLSVKCVKSVKMQLNDLYMYMHMKNLEIILDVWVINLKL